MTRLRTPSLVVSALLVGSLAAASPPGSIRSSLDAYVRTVTLPSPGPQEEGNQYQSAVAQTPVADAGCDEQKEAFLDGIMKANETTARAKTVMDAAAFPINAFNYLAGRQNVDQQHFPDISEIAGDAEALKCFQKGYTYQYGLNEERQKAGSTALGLILYAMGSVFGYRWIKNGSQTGS